MPLPNRGTMKVEYLKYGTDEYFEYQRLQGFDREEIEKTVAKQK